jgi:septal ring factor EnvC (AmiA/AmiB activator)
MSALAKIGIIAALVFGLAALGLTFVVKPKQEAMKVKLADTGANLATTQQKLASTTKELESTKNTLEATKTELATTKGDLETAKGNLEAAEKKVAEGEAKNKELAAQIEADNAKIADLEKKIAEAPAQLEELKGKMAEKDLKIAAIEGENQELTKKVKQLDAEVQNLKGGGDFVVLPSGLKGKIIVYEKNWNFVVVDIGRQDGALLNGELTVYRNLKYVGRIKLSAVNTRMAVANVLTQWSKMEIQEGDVVIPAGS